MTALFEQAAGRPAADRAEWLAGICADEPALRADVEALLIADASAEQSLDRPLVMEVPTLAGGTSLGPYTIRGLLASGGMGQVYAAYDTRIDRPVAIKVLPESLALDPVWRARFEREARTISRLNHPHICTLYDVGEHDGRLYLVMERVEGETLAARIAKGPLAVDEAVRVAIHIADALDCAHRAGIVHRDVKPANVMLTEYGAKLLDFGIAGGVVSPARAVAVSEGGAGSDDSVVVGTPAYMAPEQRRGAPPDARSDVFAAGAVLFEMLTGTQALPEARVATDLAAKAETEPRTIRDLRPDVPRSLERLVRRCLRSDPDARCRAAADLVQDLQRIASDSSASRRIAAGVGWVLGASAIAAAFAVAAFLGFPERDPGIPTARGSRSVAILPFDVRGTSRDTYFADAMADELAGRLARIPGLSASIVRRTQTPIADARQLGREAGVAAVLEGAIEREGSLVRVVVRLTSVDSGAALWSPDPIVSDVSDIFAVQSAITTQIAGALDAAASPEVSRSVEGRPTRNTEAYDAYLRAMDHFNRSDSERDARAGIVLLERAVHLDPQFTSAHAALAYGQARLWWYHYDRTPAQKARARLALDRAVALDADSPQVHKAVGFYFYWCELDYERALHALAAARKGRPGDSEIVFGYAAVLRRQGKVELALAPSSEAVRMEPRNPLYWQNIGLTYAMLRNPAEADRALARATSLNPEFPMAHALRAHWLLRLAGDVSRAREHLSRAVGLALGDDSGVVYAAVLADLFARDYQIAVDRLAKEADDVFSYQTWYVPKALLEAQANGLLGRTDAARAAYKRAATLLEARVREAPDDSRFRSALGLAYAGLGRKAEAIGEGKAAVDLLPVSREAARGAYRVEDLARIYAIVGEPEAAIDRLEYLMSIPYDLAVPGLRLDPSWDPLRNHRRFRRLIGE